MSAPRTTHHTIAGAVTAAATASVLFVLSGAAAADPPAAKPDIVEAGFLLVLEVAAQELALERDLGQGRRHHEDTGDDLARVIDALGVHPAGHREQKDPLGRRARQRLQDAQREILDACGRPLVELPLLSDGIDLGALFELAEQLGDLR